MTNPDFAAVPLIHDPIMILQSFACEPQQFSLILAAGASRRMNRCKAALPWGPNHTLLSYQVSQWQQVGLQPIVVLGPHNYDRLAPKIKAAGAIVCCNPQPDQGKTGSLLTGLAALPSCWRLLAIAAVDQPRPAAVYAALLAAHAHSLAQLTCPSHGDRLGHPLILGAVHHSALLALREDTQGLRQLIRQYSDQIQRVPLGPTVCWDLNTPIAYETAYRETWESVVE